MNPNVAYGDEEEQPDFFKSLDELEGDPIGALFRTIYCIQRSHERDVVLEYWQKNVLVQTLVASGRFLELAAAVANDLASADPDATNLRLVAAVLRKQGRAEEASQFENRATEAPDRHYEPAYLAYIERAKTGN